MKYSSFGTYEFDLPAIERWARAEFELGETSIHGLQHWHTVNAIGLTIASAIWKGQEDFMNACALMSIFALMHDVCRRDEDEDPDHGRRAAYRLCAMNHTTFMSLPLEVHEKLCYAVRCHADGVTDTDPLIGAMWDADRLDLLRVGIRPMPTLMSTDYGKSVALVGLDLYRISKAAAGLRAATKEA